ncbi:MAG: hypothetical protein JST00_31805 [Deltaproteobacteria bacterium]|nr:hypothetical protein [Deltaproteobacteria bacterium]
MRLSLLLAACFVCASTSSARADEGDATTTLLARQLATEGLRLVDEKQWSLALEKFERAESLRHAPTILVEIATCQLATGRVVQAVSTLERVVRESLPPDAPQAYLRARERARVMLETARPRLAFVVVEVDGTAPTGLALRVDGVEITSARGLDIPMNAGVHDVEGSAPGFVGATTKITLEEGAHEKVSLRLAPLAPLAPKASALPLVPAIVPMSASKSDDGTGRVAPGRSRALPWIVTGTGAAGLVVGGVLGALAFSAKADLDGQCIDRLCPEGARGDADRARGLATASVVTLGAGAAALTLGIVLNVLTPSSRSTASSMSPVTF